MSRCNPLGPFSLLELEIIAGVKAMGPLEALAAFKVRNIASLEKAKSSDLCVLHNKKYLRALAASSAGACIIPEELADYVPPSMYRLIHPNPYKAFALIAQAFYPLPRIQAYRSEHAYVAKTAQIGKDCVIEYGCYIGEGAVIGDQTYIGVHAYIGEGVIIGNDCFIDNQVTITHTTMGDHVVIYPGARIGQDGFGFASDSQGHYKIPHLGQVIIGNHVEIRANTCIDRGTLDDTIIGDHCHIDNLVQIGHNVSVGEGTVMAGQCGIAGSTKIGKFVMLAGQVGVAGHLTIGDRATVLAQSGVMKNIANEDIQGGSPSLSAKKWHQQTRFLKKITEEK